MENTPTENTTGPAVSVNISKEIILSDGRKAVIIKGKGRHAFKASRDMGDDSSKYLPYLMAQLVQVDGNPIVMEDLEDMVLVDFMAIQVAFSEQNFSSGPSK